MLVKCRDLLIEYRALLVEYRALLQEYRALLKRGQHNSFGRIQGIVTAECVVRHPQKYFCRISSLFQGSFAKEPYHFKEPTNRSQPIFWQNVGPCTCRMRDIHRDTGTQGSFGRIQGCFARTQGSFEKRTTQQLWQNLDFSTCRMRCEASTPLSICQSAKRALSICQKSPINLLKDTCTFQFLPSE